MSGEGCFAVTVSMKRHGTRESSLGRGTFRPLLVVDPVALPPHGYDMFPEVGRHTIVSGTPGRDVDPPFRTAGLQLAQ